MATVEVAFYGGPLDGEVRLIKAPPPPLYEAMTEEGVRARYGLAKSHRGGGWVYVLTAMLHNATLRRWSPS